MMTEGEKLIWAAIYAKEFIANTSSPPEYLCCHSSTDRERREWEYDQAADAAEFATASIEILKGASKERIASSAWQARERSLANLKRKTYRFARQMLGEDS
jgi:hypothetical protein